MNEPQETKHELPGAESVESALTHVANIPNGGLIAWLQVLGSFFIFFNTW